MARCCAKGLTLLSILLAHAILAAPPGPSFAATAYAKALLAQMTPEEKVGQLVLLTSHWSDTGPAGDRRVLDELIKTGRCGNVFNARTVDYIRKLQKMALEGSRLHVPLMFGFDVIHGYNTIFPIPLAEAASWDIGRIERSAQVAAREASASGLNWTYAPMVDIARDPRWGRIAEGSGEDPYLGSAIASARVRGFQGKNFDAAESVLACVKHFAAYGAAEAGRDYNSADVSERTLRQVYLPPFRAAVDAGVGSVMTAFNDLNGVPATANHMLVHDILRGEWGFKGFVVTDYNAVTELRDHGVAESDAAAALASFGAGIDMDMQSGAFLDNLVNEMRLGHVETGAVDTAAGRVLEAKYMLGLSTDPFRFLDGKREATLGHAAEHLAEATEMARRTLVLLKNERGILPLKTGLRIALIGPLGHDRKDLLGPWKAAGKPDGIETVFDALKSLNRGGTVTFATGCEVNGESREGYAEASRNASKADVIVMALGESAGMTGEAASRTSLELPGLQTELWREIKKSGKPMILVLLNGRPLTVEAEVKSAQAVIEGWFPGSAGGRPVAEALLGLLNPSGKLPVSFPRNLGQVPIYYSVKSTGRPLNPAKKGEKYKSAYLDSSNDPLFPFGFGLSYTSFIYSKPIIKDARIRSSENTSVTVRITNTGQRAGAEVVQLYIRSLINNVTRPILELRGFQRIELEPGAAQDVVFTLGKDQLEFLRADLSVGTQPGKYRILVGPNSRDLQATELEFVR